LCAIRRFKNSQNEIFVEVVDNGYGISKEN